MLMFRSIVVPLKAAAMNLLSISAAYGVLVVVFQTDAGASLIGLDHATAVSSLVPIIMFAVPAVTTAVASGAESARDWLAPSRPAYSSVTRTVLIPAFLASSDFASTMPWRSSVLPQTATAFPRRLGSSMTSTLA